jgi:hypothetical protein
MQSGATSKSERDRIEQGYDEFTHEEGFSFMMSRRRESWSAIPETPGQHQGRQQENVSDQIHSHDEC